MHACMLSPASAVASPLFRFLWSWNSCWHARLSRRHAFFTLPPENVDPLRTRGSVLPQWQPHAGLLLRPISGLWSGGLRRPKGPVPVPPLASSGAAPGPGPRAVPSAERHPDALHPYGPLRPLPSCGAPTDVARCRSRRHPAWSSAALGPRGRRVVCPSGLAFARSLLPGGRAASAL